MRRLVPGERRGARVGRSTLGLCLALCLGLAAGGCSGSREPAGPVLPKFPGVTVRVGVVGEPSMLQAVASQRGEWEASRKARCAIADTPATAANLGGAHVVLFRGDQLGALVDQGTLAVLPESVVRGPRPTTEEDGATDRAEESDELQFGDVLPVFREQVSKYGRDRQGLPLGSSALVLVYNRAAFDTEATRAAAKAAGIRLEPPATWTELDALAAFLNDRDWDGDGTKEKGLALGLADDSEGVGTATFLARAASLGQHPDHYSFLFDADTMEPRVASPPFVEALEKLVALERCMPEGALSDIGLARRAFREGRAALLIDRADRAWVWAGGDARIIGVAPLPGSERVYEPVRKVWETPRVPNRPSYLPWGGGWLVGVSATAAGRERDAAIDFVRFLANPETSNRLFSDPSFATLPVRAAQIGQAPPSASRLTAIDPRLWSEAVGKTLAAPRVVVGLRIPDAAGYLEDLNRGRVSVVRREKPAAAALKDVALAWTARTKRLGQARQVWHYRRSLNSLATAPKPPPRDAG